MAHLVPKTLPVLPITESTHVKNLQLHTISSKTELKRAFQNASHSLSACFEFFSSLKMPVDYWTVIFRGFFFISTSVLCFFSLNSTRTMFIPLELANRMHPLTF